MHRRWLAGLRFEQPVHHIVVAGELQLRWTSIPTRSTRQAAVALLHLARHDGIGAWRETRWTACIATDDP
jgi:hypothetical protein